MYEVILHESVFLKKSREDQIILIEAWRTRFTVDEIIDGMDISKNQYYNILNNLGIKIRNANIKGGSKMKSILSEEEFNNMKLNVCNYKVYKSIDLQQQIELFIYYLEEHANNSIADLARMMNTNAANLYAMNSKVKKLRQADIQEQSVEIELENTELKNPCDNIEKSLLESESNNLKEDLVKKNKYDIQCKNNSFSFDIKGNYDAKTVARRMKLILDILENDDTEFDVDIKITQK
ncbi:hypothetical protein [Bacillus clarus]|nr:hypothetical protein [Bacillus clarus]